MLHIVLNVREKFTRLKYKVRYHGHLTGKYRGATPYKFNCQYFNNRYLRVLFHNLQSYDGHLKNREPFTINQGKGHNSLCALPKPNEKFMSLTSGDKIFSDAFALLNKSLDKLVQTL